MKILYSLIFFIMSLSLLGQTGHPSIVESDVPDFGGVSGTWGHLQYYRPFGIKGILLDDWKDLTTINPLSGEVLNTDLRGWMTEQGGEQSLWGMTHPVLVAPEDTTAASVMVNYKQGDGDFNDFTLWYHNSLGKNTRYGWTSKLRSHQRFLDVTAYDEQRHRMQIETELEAHKLTVELDYAHQVNPLYLFEIDTSTQLETYRDDIQLNSDRWGGSLHLNGHDTLSNTSELFVWVQGGRWDWNGRERQSLSALAYWGKEIQFLGLPSFKVKLGGLSRQVGGASSSRHFMEIMLPGFHKEYVSIDLGVKNMGTSFWAPVILADYQQGPLNLSYRTRQVSFDRTWKPQQNIQNIHHIQTALNFNWLKLNIGAWQPESASNGPKGYHGDLQLSFPWMMKVKLGKSGIDKPLDWVWSEEQINWELNQEFILFDQALFGHLKVWGRHLINPNQGALDPETLTAGLFFDANRPDEWLHLMNYTISAQISTVVIAFTDSNILQDPLWSGYTDVEWDSEYALMRNQLPQNRFQYLSLIWVFDN